MKLTLSIFVMLLLFTGTAFRSEAPVMYQFDYENVIGTSLQLKVIAGFEQVADRAEQIALSEIDRLSKILSTYDPLSEVCMWQKTKNIPVAVSPELFEVLTLFDEWTERTSGALSATIGSASELWRKSQDTQRMPGQSELTEVKESIKLKAWQLNDHDQTAIHLTNQPVVLNSFVKSYIIRKVSEKVISIPGVTGVVTNIGGDIVISGNHSELVRIADPFADAENDRPGSIIRLSNQSIATSGNYRRGFDIGGVWFSHIIDPRTAMPAGHVASATVIANKATDAGALATAFNILTPQESAELAATIPGVQYKIVTTEGETIVSEGWTDLEISQSAGADRNVLSSNGQKLEIELELARFEGRFRRPFVAVWIENKKKESVKTLAVWYNKPRWLPDLKRWYSKNQSLLEDMSARESISSATRSPGKYTLTWNGLDDQGKALPQGVYTVYIEAAREHGTYQLIRQEISWNGKSAHFDLKGGIEISSASLTLTK
jgi:thiamine biosynthesis lipoprotein